jgi:hypothetical protein
MYMHRTSSTPRKLIQQTKADVRKLQQTAHRFGRGLSLSVFCAAWRFLSLPTLTVDAIRSTDLCVCVCTD